MGVSASSERTPRETTTLVFAPAPVRVTFLLPMAVCHLRAIFAIVSPHNSSRMEHGQLILNRQPELMVGVEWSYCQMASLVDIELPLDFLGI